MLIYRDIPVFKVNNLNGIALSLLHLQAINDNVVDFTRCTDPYLPWGEVGLKGHVPS